MKGNFIVIKISLLMLVLFSQAGYSQIDQTAPVFGVDYFPKPMKMIMPKAYEPNNYTPDVLVSVGPFDNYRATTTPGFGETHIVVNPRNPQNFIAGDNRAVISSSNVYVTTDAGLNWSNVSTSTSQGDPVFAFDSLGRAFYSVLFNGVRIWRSTNNGASWTNLGNAFSAGNTDKQWLAADQTAGPFSNYLYMAYSDFSSPVTIRFYRSTNGGTSWVGPTTLFGPGNAQGSNIAVDDNGKVYVTWYGSGGASVRTSTNGGATFTSSVLAAAYSEPGVPHSSGRLVLKGDIRVNGFPQIATDNSNGPHRGNVYLNYANNPPGPDNADIYLVRSTDGGATWNTFSPVKVNDDSGFLDQWMSDVCVDAQGRVWVYWYDSRNDIPGNLWTEVYGAVSTDGGLTFSPNFKISNQRFNPSTVKVNQGDHYYIGDYQGIDGSNTILPFWMDGRQNNMHDYTATLPDFGIEFQGADTLYSNINASVGKTVEIPTLGPYSGSVQFTSNVTPTPGAGSIGIVFTSNPLTTFPGNVNLQANVSAGVPFGTYSVNVTGTDNSFTPPRVHTRTMTLIVDSQVGITNENGTPDVYALQQNYPNPFNPSTSISYSLPERGFVSLKVYDMLGKEIANLVSEVKEAGNYRAEFNTSSLGNLSSGIYYYQIKAGDFTATKRMVLLK